MSQNLSIIVACDPKGVIGLDNNLPWGRLEGDLKRFKAITLHKTVVMGRRTFDSLPKPLTDRRMIVLTRTIQEFVMRLHQTDRYPHGHVFHVAENMDDVEGLVQAISPDEETLIIGGAEIYKMYLPLVNRLYVTLTKDNYVGNVIVPELAEIISKLNTGASEWIVESMDDAGTHSYYVLVRKV